MQLGRFHFETPLLLAPMAGVSDQPFRQLCRRLGADLAVSEMLKTAQPLQQTRIHQRADWRDESSPSSVQLIGNNPAQMAAAARFYADQGADIIDINMGCPAKKFARKPAGSALLADPMQVAAILRAVVRAVEIPVTLKIRTGIDAQTINAVEIGCIAEAEGIQALVVHGRSRAQGFSGSAQHHSTAELVTRLAIPVLANGDIDSPQEAARVLASSGAAGLMIGRAARRNPWLFRQIRHFLQHGKLAAAPPGSEIRETTLSHFSDVHDYYGEPAGLRMAARHSGWLVAGLPGAAALRQQLEHCHSKTAQYAALQDFFQRQPGALPGAPRQPILSLDKHVENATM